MVGARMETGRGSLSALPPQEAGTSSVYPLRPLNLNEIFAAALAIIRHSPKAALGIPFVAGTITLLLTLLTYAVAPSSMNRILADPLAYEDQEMALSLMGEASFLAVTALTGFVSSLLWVAAATLLIIPALRSGLGLKTSFGQALRHPPAVWGWLSLHLLMLTVLLFVGLMVGAFVALFIIIITLFIGAVVVVPVSLLALAWITTALLHAPLVIITERRTAFSAVARSFQLNRGLWWRNMGAVSLLLVMVLIIISIAAVPLGIASGVASAADQGAGPDEGAAVWMMIGLHVFEAALNAVGVALMGAGVAMIHISSRIRQEALDVRLSRTVRQMQADGDEPSPAALAQTWRAP